MVDSLYSTSDVKKERERLYKIQKGIDPILQEEIKFTDSVCDHDHQSQHTRGALHRQMNAFEGKVTNAFIRYLSWATNSNLPDVLRNLAKYLEDDYSNNPYHPNWIKRVTIDFCKLNVKGQTAVLHTLGATQGKNAAERKKLFDKAVKTKQFTYLFIKELIDEANSE